MGFYGWDPPQTEEPFAWCNWCDKPLAAAAEAEEHRDHADTEGERRPERRAVDAGELGTPIRFEIETDQGWIIRFDGDNAAAHVRALDAACAIAASRGVSFPTALPLVFGEDEVRRRRDERIAAAKGEK